MSQTVTVCEEQASIIINNLKITIPDFYALVKSEAAESREQLVQDILAVGSAAMQRLRTTVDVEFVEKRFGTLANVFDKTLGELEKRATDAVSKRFSPTESGSYTKQIGDLIIDAKRDVQGWRKELEAKAESLLDPDKKTSAVGKLDQLVQLAAARFQQMFDPDLRNSYAYRLNQNLSQIFGTDGHAGVLQNALGEALGPVFTELRELKEKVEARKAVEQILETSTLKGRPFEELVHAELARLAGPYFDEVEFVGSGSNGSRAGDFVVTLSGIGKKVVFEARNRKQMSLPAIKSDLDREMAERAADFAVCVSSGPDMLPQHVGEFHIYGNKLVVTLRNLHIAYRLIRVLASTQSSDGLLDLGGLRSTLTKIRDAARSMRDIKGKATQVKKFAEGINSAADEAEETIECLIEEAEKLLEPTPLSQTA